MFHGEKCTSMSSKHDWQPIHYISVWFGYKMVFKAINSSSSFQPKILFKKPVYTVWWRRPFSSAWIIINYYVKKNHLQDVNIYFIDVLIYSWEELMIHSWGLGPDWMHSWGKGPDCMDMQLETKPLTEYAVGDNTKTAWICSWIQSRITTRWHWPDWINSWGHCPDWISSWGHWPDWISSWGPCLDWINSWGPCLD